MKRCGKSKVSEMRRQSGGEGEVNWKYRGSWVWASECSGRWGKMQWLGRGKIREDRERGLIRGV